MRLVAGAMVEVVPDTFRGLANQTRLDSGLARVVRPCFRTKTGETRWLIRVGAVPSVFNRGFVAQA